MTNMAEITKNINMLLRKQKLRKRVADESSNRTKKSNTVWRRIYER